MTAPRFQVPWENLKGRVLTLGWINGFKMQAASDAPTLSLTLEDKETLLEELADWVTSIDNARGGWGWFGCISEGMGT